MPSLLALYIAVIKVGPIAAYRYAYRRFCLLLGGYQVVGAVKVTAPVTAQSLFLLGHALLAFGYFLRLPMC
jgi:hypothetical protein